MHHLRGAVAGLLCAATSVAAQQPVLTVQQSGTTALLQAVSVSARDPNVVWISGHRGTYTITTDGGSTWTSHVVPGRDSLEFRDVHAIDATRAWLMAAGPGAKSGIFQTTDGGATWRAAFVNRDTAAFFDCMAFADDRHGFAFSDAVGATIPLARTTNGRDWALSGIAGLGGEGGFAASGGCAQASRSGGLWIATGSADTPRVLHSTNGGDSWSAVPLPLVSGNGAGATAVTFRDRQNGIVVGGPIGSKANGPRVARTTDGGLTWVVAGEPPLQGALYGATYVHVGKRWCVVAVGPGGAAWSPDDGATWTMFDTGSYWSVGASANGTVWLSGPRGRITRGDWR